MLKFSISFVNGSYQEFEESDSIFVKLKTLQKSGLEGKALVHELLTDDWGAPPVIVKLTGVLEDGTIVDENIGYN